MSHPDPSHDPENELREDMQDTEGDTLCGKPHNNASDEDECLECQIIKKNL